MLSNFQLEVLKETPGSEAAMLQHLLQLTSREGIALPPSATTTEKISASMMSINTASDDSDHTNQMLWNDISMKLRQCFIEKLTKLPVGQPKSVISISHGKRLQYVQSLCSLYPAEDIWNRYKSMRSHQLDSCLLCCKQEVTGQHITFIRGVSHFSGLLQKIWVMVDEDFELLNTGL